MGTVYINSTDDDKLFRQINYFSPPILLLFFVRSGLSFDLGALMGTSGAIGTTSLLVVSITYFVIRIAGKYIGAFFGSAVVKKKKEVRNYLGLALIPQAGVAIGLAAIGARSLGGEMGSALETIILASSVLYELVGPVCAKLSLYLSKSYSTKLEELVSVEETTDNGEKKTSLELLIERIHKIQEELPKHEINEDEQAFTNAAVEHFDNMYSFRHTKRPGNRR
jgi:Kef-type K+ transport system membrane component KefB